MAVRRAWKWPYGGQGRADRPVPTGACEGRWAWLRYGQYVVQIQVSNDPTAQEGIPSWLTTAIQDAATTLTNRAPRE